MASDGVNDVPTTDNNSNVSDSEVSLEAYLVTLPTELKLAIIEQLEWPIETGRWKKELPGFSRFLDEVERLAVQDRSQEAIRDKMYSCLFCMTMLNEWKFSDSELVSKKARFAVYAPRRYCIECGVTKLQGARENAAHAKAFPHISQPSGYARGMAFYVRGEQFVVCQECNQLGMVGSEQESKQNRKLLCDVCTSEREALPPEEVLPGIWEFAQSVSEAPEDLRGLRTQRWRRRAHVKSVQDGGNIDIRFPEMRRVGAINRAYGYSSSP